MAVNWLKVETTTPDKKEMLRLGHLCKLSKADTFLAWFQLWAYFDREANDGFVPGMTRSAVDKIAEVPGFAVALEDKDVDWIYVDSTGLTVAEWDIHNGKKAKKRALDAKRKKNYRQKKSP